MLTVLLEASTLVGEFEKPIYVNVDQGLCAHSRNRKTGCTRCLDLCPAGAIAPDGDAVAVDPALCGGCGLCAGACPTSAITYAYPDVQSVHQRIMTLAAAYRDAGGRAPRLLVHDDKAGTRLIEAAARYGRGLPADAIPMAVNEVGQVGHDILLGALAQGFQEVVLLTDPQRPDDYAGLAAQIAVTEAILTGLGDAGGRVRVLDTGDPEALSESLFGSRPATILPTATFVPLGRKKAITRLAAKGLAAGPRGRRSRRCRCRRARPTAGWRSTPAAARSAWPASAPARPAPCRTTRTARSCCSRRTPACSAACAPPPAPKR